MSDFLKLVGEQIRYIRKTKGLTQQTLAEKSNLQLSYISDVERGERNISLETLEKIITSLEIAPIEIFNFNSTDIENDSIEKRMLIESLRALLQERRINEVRFIRNVANEFINTVDKDH
ncbi:MerR family transcriptional regulator [Brevibacillus panacihumi W25]|uniref:MerR family transcriptional regulator n=1 Tax=Brevibacillus panacihumi W25 TaxID=1408254 RepID=V6MJ93_9BACL|nr:helix-turn-helix transcriptional regulator [Brevibacillus panacihumi]EST55518.1 MerR family transcriptional regulator [Brevibacillus panacihumi W25]